MNLKDEATHLRAWAEQQEAEARDLKREMRMKLDRAAAARAGAYALHGHGLAPRRRALPPRKERRQLTAGKA